MPEFLDKWETESTRYSDGKFLSWKGPALYPKQDQAHEVLYLSF